MLKCKDIGGTSVDCGTLVKGFPRQSSAVVEVGEVRTNFRMPDVFSFAMGIHSNRFFLIR